MKILFIPFILFLTSCCKEEKIIETNINCINMEANPNFTTENFKDGYTIQFPSHYTGDGLLIDESATFEKKSGADIYFSYLYSSPVDGLVYFGQKLANPIPDKLESPSQSLIENLSLKKEFCLNDDIELVLYYSLNSNAASFGKLYMKHKDWYYEGLTIFFRAELFDEVEAVIKTIRKE
jgi:hypothetical protein